MAELGTLPHVIEAILNHVSGHRAGVAGIYNRATYANEMREALERWGDHIGAITQETHFPDYDCLNRAGADVDTLTFHWPSLGANNMVARAGYSALGGQMPHYFFTVQSEGDATERAAELKDDEAALAFACEIVRELTQSLAHTDRTSLVEVRDETRSMVLSIPFLAACA